MPPIQTRNAARKCEMECLNVNKAFAQDVGVTKGLFLFSAVQHTLNTAERTMHTVSINNPNIHKPSPKRVSQSPLPLAAKTTQPCLSAVAATGVQRHKVP